MEIRKTSFEKSSALVNAEWDPITHTMKIEFKNSGIYEFYGVEEAVFDELCESESAGRYFHQNIKGKYGTYSNNDKT